jgi:6-phosphofructokinase
VDFDDVVRLYPSSVSVRLQTAGTMLQTSRRNEIEAFIASSPDLAKQIVGENDEQARMSALALIGRLAAKSLELNDVDRLVLLGGDQTCEVARAIKVAGRSSADILVIPATIDNDVLGTTTTIGFDSAVAAAVQATDRIRATAASHSRIFVVQVMGRGQGRIAAEVALATGAEAVIAPERGIIEEQLALLIHNLETQRGLGRQSAVIIVAEGAADPPGTKDDEYAGRIVTQRLADHFGEDWDVRLSVLGHMQRGAEPTFATRNLATRMALKALDPDLLADRDEGAYMIGVAASGDLDIVKIGHELVRLPDEPLLEVFRMIDRLGN